MRAPPQTPDMDSHPACPISHSYIQLIQHLIERCLLFYMDREECASALAKYAHVKPLVTVTVWNELEKANKEFFVAYLRRRSGRQNRALNGHLDEATVKLRLHNLKDCTEREKICQEGRLQLSDLLRTR